MMPPPSATAPDMPPFFDTHAHLDFPEFAADLELVRTRAREAGITRILTIGCDHESSCRAIALAEKHPEIYAVVGWHPTHVMDAPADVRPALRELARHPRVVAIGEAGVDHYRLPSQQPGGTAADDERYRQKQIEVFSQQLDVAAELGLNVVIHQRAAWAPTVATIRPYQGRVRGVFHCFSEPLPSLAEVLALDCLVSFTGILTFKNGQNIREALKATPMGRFMLETDCPFLAPVPYRGKRCEPAFVKEIAQTAAEVKGVSLEELSRVTCETAEAFFRFDRQ